MLHATAFTLKWAEISNDYRHSLPLVGPFIQTKKHTGRQQGECKYRFLGERNSDTPGLNI